MKKIITLTSAIVVNCCCFGMNETANNVYDTPYCKQYSILDALYSSIVLDSDTLRSALSHSTKLSILKEYQNLVLEKIKEGQEVSNDTFTGLWEITKAVIFATPRDKEQNSIFDFCKNFYPNMQFYNSNNLQNVLFAILNAYPENNKITFITGLMQAAEGKKDLFLYKHLLQAIKCEVTWELDQIQQPLPLNRTKLLDYFKGNANYSRNDLELMSKQENIPEHTRRLLLEFFKISDCMNPEPKGIEMVTFSTGNEPLHTDVKPRGDLPKAPPSKIGQMLTYGKKKFSALFKKSHKDEESNETLNKITKETAEESKMVTFPAKKESNETLNKITKETAEKGKMVTFPAKEKLPLITPQIHTVVKHRLDEARKNGKLTSAYVNMLTTGLGSFKSEESRRIFAEIVIMELVQERKQNCLMFYAILFAWKTNPQQLQSFINKAQDCPTTLSLLFANVQLFAGNLPKPQKEKLLASEKFSEKDLENFLKFVQQQNDLLKASES